MNKGHYIAIFILIFILGLKALPANAQDVDIHGFISQGYLQTSHNNYMAETDNGSFQFNEMGINFTTFATTDLKIGCQFFARDLGDIGNDEITVNWAFGEYTFRNWLRLRAGIIKYGWGFYSDLWDLDSMRTSIFLPTAVYNEWLRDDINRMKGGELFGSIDIGRAGLLEYQFQAGATPLSKDRGTAKFITEINREGLKSISEIDSGNSYLGRLIWSLPMIGFRIGAMYITSSVRYEGLADVDLTEYGYPGVIIEDAPIIIDAKNIDLYVFSAEFIWGHLKFSAENSWDIGESVSIIEAFGDTIKTERKKDNRHPFYISAGYRFSDWFETGFYYSSFKNDVSHPADANKLIDYCLSLRFDINPNWVAKLESHVFEGKYGISPDNDGHSYNEWMLYAAKVSFSF